MSMTPEEKAEFDQLKADKAALEQEVADLKKRKKKADVDGKLSAAGFKQNTEGKFSGLSDATYSMLLSADDDTLAAVIADTALIRALQGFVPKNGEGKSLTAAPFAARAALPITYDEGYAFFPLRFETSVITTLNRR